jgi:hypothetical protein
MGMFNWFKSSGGCCCGDFTCIGCELPREDLTVAYTDVKDEGTGFTSGSATLTYMGPDGFGSVVWQTACINSGTAKFFIYLSQVDNPAADCIYLLLEFFETDPENCPDFGTLLGCSAVCFDITGFCVGSSTMDFITSESTCSPLSILLISAGGEGGCDTVNQTTGQLLITL